MDELFDTGQYDLLVLKRHLHFYIVSEGMTKKAESSARWRMYTESVALQYSSNSTTYDVTSLLDIMDEEEADNSDTGTDTDTSDGSLVVKISGRGYEYDAYTDPYPSPYFDKSGYSSQNGTLGTQDKDKDRDRDRDKDIDKDKDEDKDKDRDTHRLRGLDKIYDEEAQQAQLRNRHNLLNKQRQGQSHRQRQRRRQRRRLENTDVKKATDTDTDTDTDIAAAAASINNKCDVTIEVMSDGFDFASHVCPGEFKSKSKSKSNL